MKATITVNMDGAEFDDEPGLELRVILASLSDRLTRNGPSVGESILLRDTNGNTVGRMEISE